jgi:hypothetical protein
MITERENLINVIRHTGKAKWLPILNDCMTTFCPSVSRDRPVMGEDGFDWFGCYWLFDPQLKGYVQPLDHPFPVTDIRNWREQIRFPDLDALDWEAGARNDLKGYDPINTVLYIKTDSGAFERLHQLIGFENAFLAMYDHPEEFLGLMDAITDFRIRYYGKICEYYPADMICMMDDLGSNRGPLMSLEMYRQFIKPFDARIADAIHQLGPYVVYHSCGCMQDFMDDLLELGADVIHPLQGRINQQEEIASKYGDRVAFFHGLSVLVNLADTSEESLRAEMRRVMDIFWEQKALIVQPNSFVPGRPGILLEEARRFNAEHMQN